ncbi:MAG TPA: HupE/UreJ family protein [Gammaproteobacteria bacterium]|nr:HupE/UreJ family protein [Gammaproteobacteria bacterium]
MKRNIIRLFTLSCALPVSATALAHTGSHEVSGFLAGLGHPLTGPDHLAAMLAVGFWAALGLQRQARMLIPAFLVFMCCGAAAGMAGAVMPGLETGIATSVLVMGLLVATQARLPAGVGIALAGLFALFHGSSHGAEMPVAAAPLLYAAGFLLSTAALQLGGFALGRILLHVRTVWLLRGAGILTGGFGAWLLLGA